MVIASFRCCAAGWLLQEFVFKDTSVEAASRFFEMQDHPGKA
jgi:hypothetical protein